MEQSVTDPLSQSIPALFSAQVRRSPGAVAVHHGERHLTYDELDRRANQLAHGLRRHGVDHGVMVGVAAERSIEAVIAILGILKAGGVYVPLDPAYPSSRLAFMLRDTGAPVVLAGPAQAAALPAGAARVLLLDGEGTAFADAPSDAPPLAIGPEAPAYVLYTSGSTGTPKGVVVPHRAVIRLVCNADFVQVRPDDGVGHLASLSFDAATFELWGSLLNGARLVVLEKETVLSPAACEAAIRDDGVTVAFFASALFNQLVSERPGMFAPMRCLIVGGEALSPSHVRQALRHGPPDRLLNGYGPTENTTFTTWHEITDVAPGAAGVPIGRPVAHTTVHILDENLRPVAPGTTGELCTGGLGLALGYLNQPALTAERFVPDPLAETPEARLYRTGDLVRQRPDGVLEFVGRKDHQVKLRGYRIELGEIEATLRRHPAVREAVVLLREDTPGDPRLVAYLVTGTGNGLAPGDLRAFAGVQLPDFMIPSAFILLPTWPLTPNGKVDRRALPAPSGHRAETMPRIAPRTATEAAIAEIWREVLHLDDLGVYDDFLAVGGHSLKATMIAARLRAALHCDLPACSLFEHPTVAALAERVGPAVNGKAITTDRIVPVPRHTPIPLSMAQERVWFLTHLHPDSLAYHFQASVRFTGQLDVEALCRSLSEIVRRHEIYRTTFEEEADRPVQRIRAPWAVSLPVDDLPGEPEDTREAAAEAIVSREAGTPFDLARLPLVRWRLLRLRDDEHLLVHVEHHIVHDGWGFVVFLHELAALYGAFTRGRPSPLAEPELQFADFAHWQHRWIQTEAAQAHLDYWRTRLADLPPSSTFPADYPRPATQRFKGTILNTILPGVLCEALRRLSRHEETTLYVTMLAAFFTLLYRYTRQRDLAVGAGVACRGRHETEGMMGMFVNNVVLRADLGDRPRFRDVLKQVRATTLQAFTHEEAPFDHVVRAVAPQRHPGRNPLFQVMFSFHDTPLDTLDFPGLDVCVNEGLSNGSAKFDMNIIGVPLTADRIVGDPGERPVPIRLVIEYNTDLYAAATVERLARDYQALLDALVADPDALLDEVPLPGADGQLSRVPSRPAVEDRRIEDESAVPPQAPTPIQTRLAAIWRDVLGVERVGLYDDFFALGGHSLLVMRILARIDDAFGVRLPVASFFTAPSVARLSALVEQAILREVEALSDEAAAAFLSRR